MADDIFKSLDIDKSKRLGDIKHGDSSSASFMACVEECISERKIKVGNLKRDLTPKLN